MKLTAQIWQGPSDEFRKLFLYTPKQRCEEENMQIFNFTNAFFPHINVPIESMSVGIVLIDSLPLNASGEEIFLALGWSRCYFSYD